MVQWFIGGEYLCIVFGVLLCVNWQILRPQIPRPQGIFGGDSGASGSFQVNGESVKTQNRIKLEAEDVIRLELPGGGGYGKS